MRSLFFGELQRTVITSKSQGGGASFEAIRRGTQVRVLFGEALSRRHRTTSPRQIGEAGPCAFAIEVCSSEPARRVGVHGAE